MGISKYNAEGYYDPTAYEGIRQADANARKLKINYPTGYMELNLVLICTLNRQCHCTINRPEIRNNMQKYAQYIILSNQHFADCYS